MKVPRGSFLLSSETKYRGGGVDEEEWVDVGWFQSLEDGWVAAQQKAGDALDFVPHAGHPSLWVSVGGRCSYMISHQPSPSHHVM